MSLIDKVMVIMHGEAPALKDRVTSTMWGYDSQHTSTGDVPNKIDLDPDIPTPPGFTNEHVAFTFGRFSIPHKGHGKVFERLKEEAGGGDFVAFASLSHNEKNPLVFEQKQHFVKSFFDVDLVPAKTLFEAIETLQEKYKSATFVIGEDRFVEFKKLLEKYSDQIDMTIGVVAVDRDDEYSATNLREAALNGDYVKFDSYLPESTDESWNLYQIVCEAQGRIPSPQERKGSERTIGSDVDLGDPKGAELSRRRSLKKFKAFVDET